VQFYNPDQAVLAITALTDTNGKAVGWLTNQSALDVAARARPARNSISTWTAPSAAHGQVGSDGNWKLRVTLAAGDHFILAQQTGSVMGLASFTAVSVDLVRPSSLQTEYTVTDTLKVTMQVSSPDYYPLATQAIVDIDRNGDGDFSDPGELNVMQVPASEGATTFYIDPRQIMLSACASSEGPRRQ